MSRVKQDGVILHGLDGQCILVRGDSLPEVLEHAKEWAAEEGYVLTDPDAVRLQWIRAVPCPDREHSHDGWECDGGPGTYYMPSREGRGAFRGVLADIAYKPADPKCSTCRDKGKVEIPEPDGTGLYDQACPDCDTPYPVTGDPDAEDPFAGWRFTCTTHGWKNMREPCPRGDGTDNGPDGLGPKEDPR